MWQYWLGQLELRGWTGERKRRLPGEILLLAAFVLTSSWLMHP